MPPPQEAELLRRTLAVQLTGLSDTCVDSATSAEFKQRSWADIIFFEGGARYTMADSPEFKAIENRFYRAKAAASGSLRMPRLPTKRGNKFGQGWWNKQFCDERISYHRPLYDGDMAFVVSDSRHLTYYHVFVRRAGKWSFLASGHARRGGGIVI